MITIIVIDAVLLLMLMFLLVVKTIHFFKAIKHKRAIDWFYFSHYNIVLSSSSESAEAKRKQNAYTISIGAMMILICFAAYIEMLLLK